MRNLLALAKVLVLSLCALDINEKYVKKRNKSINRSFDEKMVMLLFSNEKQEVTMSA